MSLLCNTNCNTSLYGHFGSFCWSCWHTGTCSVNSTSTHLCGAEINTLQWMNRRFVGYWCVVWSHLCDYAIHITFPWVLQCYIRSILEVWESVSLSVIVFGCMLFFSLCDVALPLWSKQTVMGWQVVLDGIFLYCSRARACTEFLQLDICHTMPHESTFSLFSLQTLLSHCFEGSVVYMYNVGTPSALQKFEIALLQTVVLCLTMGGFRGGALGAEAPPKFYYMSKVESF